MIYEATVVCYTVEEFNSLLEYWYSKGLHWDGFKGCYAFDWNYNLLQIYNDDKTITQDYFDSWDSVEDEFLDSDWNGTFEEYMEYVGGIGSSVDVDVSEFL